ncbi:hypothetical protein [Pantoea sp. B65]|uniref:hypothetical protein n=1 Tax=Pantoea sp. B65 TaxID=2813359 RepID=UPI0039B54E6E
MVSILVTYLRITRVDFRLFFGFVLWLFSEDQVSQGSSACQSLLEKNDKYVQMLFFCPARLVGFFSAQENDLAGGGKLRKTDDLRSAVGRFFCGIFQKFPKGRIMP